MKQIVLQINTDNQECINAFYKDLGETIKIFELDSSLRNLTISTSDGSKVLQSYNVNKTYIYYSGPMCLTLECLNKNLNSQVEKPEGK